MKIVFFGTPQTALPFLDFLLTSEEVVAVVTRPDQPRGRGQKIQKSPIKLLAEEKSIPILQPTQLKDSEFLSFLKEQNPEIGIVVAYGRLIPKELIELFPKGIYNVHFSLLPNWRGASPMQWALLSGDKITGVTTFKLSETLDTGEIWVQEETLIDHEEDMHTLEAKLIPLGVAALKETIKRIKTGQIEGVPQRNSIASVARLLKKEDAKIQWDTNPVEIDRKIRALIEIGAYTILPNGQHLKILRAQVAPSSFESLDPPGTIVQIERGRGFLIKCSKGVLMVLEVQLEGKNRMEAWSFLQGHKLQKGDHLR